MELQPFPKGFLLIQEREDTGERETSTPGWFEETSLGGGWVIRHDPALELAAKRGQHFTISVIGVAYSLSLGVTSPSEALEALERVFAGRDSLDRFVQFVTQLSGRFVVAVTGQDTLMIAGDPLGSIATWWGCKDSFAVSNYSKLLADYFGDDAHNQKTEFFAHPDYKSNQPWLSNIVPEHDVALPILPNHVLTFDNGEIAHERFYPCAPLQKMSVEAATEIVHEELRFAVECLSQRKKLYFSITSGDDAFAFVDVTADLLREAGAIGVTYAFLNREANPTHGDLIGANRRMVSAQLAHQVVPMEFDWGSDFASVYNETHPTMAVFPTLAKSIYAGTAGDNYFLTGHGGEIGNVFYKERVSGFPAPADLGEKNGTRQFAESSFGATSIGEFIEYTQFYEDRFFGYDPYDLLYWENRLGRWGARMIGEWDFGARPVSPFASRRLLDSMMAVPYADRVNRSIYRTMHDTFGQIESQ